MRIDILSILPNLFDGAFSQSILKRTALEYSKLKSINASSKFYPSTADEYPILFVIAALTSGVSI